MLNITKFFRTIVLNGQYVLIINKKNDFARFKLLFSRQIDLPHNRRFINHVSEKRKMLYTQLWQLKYKGSIV